MGPVLTRNQAISCRASCFVSRHGLMCGRTVHVGIRLACKEGRAWFRSPLPDCNTVGTPTGAGRFKQSSGTYHVVAASEIYNPVCHSSGGKNIHELRIDTVTLSRIQSQQLRALWAPLRRLQDENSRNPITRYSSAGKRCYCQPRPATTARYGCLAWGNEPSISTWWGVRYAVVKRGNGFSVRASY